MAVPARRPTGNVVQTSAPASHWLRTQELRFPEGPARGTAVWPPLPLPAVPRPVPYRCSCRSVGGLERSPPAGARRRGRAGRAPRGSIAVPRRAAPGSAPQCQCSAAATCIATYRNGRRCSAGRRGRGGGPRSLLGRQHAQPGWGRRGGGGRGGDTTTSGISVCPVPSRPVAGPGSGRCRGTLPVRCGGRSRRSGGSSVAPGRPAGGGAHRAVTCRRLFTASRPGKVRLCPYLGLNLHRSWGWSKAAVSPLGHRPAVLFCHKPAPQWDTAGGRGKPLLCPSEGIRSGQRDCERGPRALPVKLCPAKGMEPVGGKRRLCVPVRRWRRGSNGPAPPGAARHRRSSRREVSEGGDGHSCVSSHKGL